MAVIFAVVGGAVVIGLCSDSDHSDYSDYSNYDNYSNYSDAAERRERRLRAKQEETESARQKVNEYKSDSVNPCLTLKSLIMEPGESVEVPSVQRNGNEKITDEERKKIDAETADMKKEVNEIDQVISKIDKLLEEKP